MSSEMQGWWADSAEPGQAPGGRAETRAAAGPPAGSAARPRLKRANRNQMQMRVVDVERLIPEDHPARAIWEFVGRLDLSLYYQEIRAVDGVAGRSAFDPQLLISLWVYGYSQGVGSARAISRLCETDPAYQWLTGLEGITGHTLSDFRVQHDEALKELFVQVLGLLSSAGLVTLERVMHDGTKVRASAASDSFRTREGVLEHLELARQQVAAVSAVEEEETSRQMERARERGRREREQRLASALKEWAGLRQERPGKEEAKLRVSTTDPEARVMKQPDGGFAPSYNVQISTDAAQMVVVGVDVVQEGNDFSQLTPAVERIEVTFGEKPDQMVADGGYVSRDNIVAMASKEVEFIGPQSEEKGKGEASYHCRGVNPEYKAAAFVYHPETDTYRCPQGKVLLHEGKQQLGLVVSHKYRAALTDCRSCPAKPKCCPENDRTGRSIQRPEEFPEVTEFRERMRTETARAIYRQRAQVGEFPNLWIKAKFGLRQFHVRGLQKVGMEAFWACLTYNICQWRRRCWQPRRSAALAAA